MSAATRSRNFITVSIPAFCRKGVNNQPFTPQENPKGYDDNSPINYADGLHGKFLLVHGSGDDNVHYQNSMDFAEALVQANKQFELQIYPNKTHGIRGGNTSLHLYTRMTNFILENL